MDKPEKVTTSYYRYSDIINYIEKKYNISTDDIAGRSKYYADIKEKADALYGSSTWYTKSPDNMTETEKEQHKLWQDLYKQAPEYQSFWDIYCDDISGNGSFMYISFEPLDSDYKGNYPEWAKKILTMIRDEFSPDGEDLKVWVEW